MRPYQARKSITSKLVPQKKTPFCNFAFRSTGYGDELTWAAVWMYKATKDNKYIEQAENFYNSYRLKERPNEFFYNKKVAGVQVNQTILLANRLP